MNKKIITKQNNPRIKHRGKVFKDSQLIKRQLEGKD